MMSIKCYYDAGFTLPDDVTLLLCDNNWGYIRRIGRDFERKPKEVPIDFSCMGNCLHRPLCSYTGRTLYS